MGPVDDGKLLALMDAATGLGGQVEECGNGASDGCPWIEGLRVHGGHSDVPSWRF